jgi:hypothetical protein
MGEIRIKNFATNAGPSLGVVDAKSGTGDDYSETGGSLCLGWNGGTGQTWWSLFPWTESYEILKANITGRPSVCNGNDTMVVAWKNSEGTGMSWATVDATAPESPTSFSTVPNHAHTDSSPAVVPGEQGFTLIWKGDASNGGSGTDKKLWSMSYGVNGWTSPVQVSGAKPSGSPSATLGSPAVYEGWLSTYAAWTDSSGQIWWSQWSGSTGLPGPWSPPLPGPTAFTVASPAIACFHGSLVVAWTLEGSGWIMVSTLEIGSSSNQWSNPARIGTALTRNGPALAVWENKLYVAWRGFTDDAIYYEVFGSLGDLPKPSNSKSFLIPIINTHVHGIYTASILVGSQQDQANVIVDTGSSTLAVLPSKYRASHDTALVKTSLAQRAQYGTGGQTGWWYGPVVETKLTIQAADGPSLKIHQDTTSIGIAVGASGSPAIFANADGIMGLAYSNLNTAYDLASYLTNLGHSSKTYPWVLDTGSALTDLTAFNAVVSTSGVTTQSVPPVFTQLEQQGLLANKFALYTHRALISYYTTDITTDPRNNGYLVLGGGEGRTDLYLGTFQTAAVMDDKYYYVNLISVQVGNNAPIIVNSAGPDPGHSSNALVDSGTSQILFEESLFQQIINQFKAINAQFPQLMGYFPGVPYADVDFTLMPTLIFVFSGSDGADVTLRCDPGVYWQIDSPQKGLVTCTLGSAGSGGASIMGLTLLNPYYTIFDRSVGGNGVIKFAEKILYYE